MEEYSQKSSVHPAPVRADGSYVKVLEITHCFANQVNNDDKILKMLQSGYLTEDQRNHVNELRWRILADNSKRTVMVYRPRIWRDGTVYEKKNTQ